MKKIILVILLLLQACDYSQKNKENYELHKNLCPENYIVSVLWKNELGKKSYHCCKVKSEKAINECVKAANTFNKDFSGQFEDIDTKHIKNILELCQKQVCLEF